MRAVPTLAILAVISIVYFTLSLSIIGLYYQLASTANSAASEALSFSLNTVDIGQSALALSDLTAMDSNASSISAVNSIHQIMDQNDALLHTLQITSIHAVLDDIRAHVDAAAQVVEGMVLAWNAGYLSTCNLDAMSAANNHTTPNTVAFFEFFAEYAAAYPGYFRYIWFEEPASDNRLHWLECGWAATAEGDTLYAMGNDQRWLYWAPDPSDIRSETILFVEAEPYPVEKEVEFWLTLGEFIGWAGEGVYNEYNETYTLAGYAQPVYRNETMAGLMGVSLELGFLVESLRRSMPTPTSTVFIVDLNTEEVVAHTNPHVSQYPEFVDIEGTHLSPHLFPIAEIPDLLIRAALEKIRKEFGNSSGASDAVLEVDHNETSYILVTAVFQSGRMHWLACQLTSASFFTHDVVLATEALADSTNEALHCMMVCAEQASMLNIMGEAARAFVGVNKATVEAVRSSVMRSAASVVIMIAFVVAALVLAVVFVVRPVRRLAKQMNLVAELHLEDAEHPSRQSHILEIDSLWQSFAAMVVQLAAYKQFLPEIVICPLILLETVDDDDEEKPTCPLSPPSERPKGTRDNKPVKNPISPLMSLPPLTSIPQSDTEVRLCSSSVVLHQHDERSPTPQSPLPDRLRTIMSADSLGNTVASASVISVQSSASSGHITLFHYATVLCIQLSDISRMMQCFTTVMTVRKLTQFLQLVQKHVRKDGVPISFFGDRVFVIFKQPSHSLSALKAAIELSREAGAAALQVSMGVSTGRLLAGAMGTIGLKTFNAVGQPFGTAASLVAFCCHSKALLLVDEEVMLKGRFMFLFIPIAVIECGRSSDFDDFQTHCRAVYLPTRSSRIEGTGEWMS